MRFVIKNTLLCLHNSWLFDCCPVLVKHIIVISACGLLYILFQSQYSIHPFYEGNPEKCIGINIKPPLVWHNEHKGYAHQGLLNTLMWKGYIPKRHIAELSMYYAGVTKTQTPKTQTSDPENSDPENSDPLKSKLFSILFT